MILFFFFLTVILFYFCIYICELLERCAFPTGKIRRLNFIGEIRGITWTEIFEQSMESSCKSSEGKQSDSQLNCLQDTLYQCVTSCLLHSLYSTRCKNRINNIEKQRLYSDTPLQSKSVFYGEKSRFDSRNLFFSLFTNIIRATRIIWKIVEISENSDFENYAKKIWRGLRKFSNLKADLHPP